MIIWVEKINRYTGTKYNQSGYDFYGYNEEGYDRGGYNKQGVTSWGNIRPVNDDLLYPYAVELVNYYLDSKYVSLPEMYKNEESITKDRFEEMLNVISRKNPNLYDEIKQKFIHKRNLRFVKFITGLRKTINKINNGIENPDGTMRNYEYFDLILDTGNGIETFSENLVRNKKKDICLQQRKLTNLLINVVGEIELR